MNKGWRFESHRHSLAAKGISTSPKEGYWRNQRIYAAAKSCLNPACGITYETTLIHNPLTPAKCPRCGFTGSIRSTSSTNGLPEAAYAKKSTLEKSPVGQIDSVKGIPIIAEGLEPDQIYPISVSDLKKRLELLPKDELEGIEAIHFKKPVGEQKDAYGQYVRSKRSIYIFAQPFDGKTVDGQNPEIVRKHILGYVVPHEIGHHKSLFIKKQWDKDIDVAEARADAHVMGFDVDDKAVKEIAKARSAN